MPTSSRGGYPVDPSVNRRFSRAEDDIRQLRERFAIPQKIPAAPSSTVSATVAKCAVPDNPQINTDTRYYSANGWTFSVNESGEPGPELTNDPGDPRAFLVAEAGYYIFRWRNSIQFLNSGPTPPNFLDCQISRGNSFNDLIRIEGVYAGQVGSALLSSISSGAFMDWATGPCYLGAGENVWPRIRYAGTAPVTSDGPGLVMEVTKIG